MKPVRTEALPPPNPEDVVAIGRVNREETVAAVRRRMAAEYPGAPIEMMCVQWADITVQEINRRAGRRVAQLQAGSMSWPLGGPDDGVSPTHLSYEWQKGSTMRQVLGPRGELSVGLPEIHVWVALIATRELVDLSTRYFPQRAREFGLAWHGPVVDYLWGTAPTGVSYVPDLEAIKLIYQALAPGPQIFRVR